MQNIIKGNPPIVAADMEVKMILLLTLEEIQKCAHNRAANNGSKAN